MSLWPYSVELDETSIALADVVADVTLHRGRESISDDPTADTLQVVFHDVDHAFVAGFDVGQSLELTVRDGAGPILPRFSGRITDARLDVDELTVIGAGLLSTFRNHKIGTSNWPAESWSARITRIFTEAGLASRLELHADADFNPLLAARDAATAGPTTLADYLAFLAPMVGALVADRPNGNVVVQAIGARSLDDAIDVDPADVAFAPVWELQLPGGNIVTVTYQADQGASVTVTDAASVAQYGDRPVTIDTSFQNASDATTRGNARLYRSAYSHWEMAAAPILRGLDLELGVPVVLTELPPASPFEPWTPIIEGWTDTISGEVWSMELALSDPLISGVTLPWDAVPIEPAYRWSTIDPSTDWIHALTLDDLEMG